MRRIPAIAGGRSTPRRHGWCSCRILEKTRLGSDVWVGPDTGARRQYLQLVRAALAVQEHFGQSVACDVAAGVLHLLDSVDAAVSVGSGSDAAFSTGPLLAVTAGFVAFPLLRLVVLVEACSATATRAQRVRCLLQDWLPALRFSAAGFFYVDRSLFVSVVSVVCTYGVLLYQFRSY